jgi:hypothetical protein
MGGFSRASLNAFDNKNKTEKSADMLYKLGAELLSDFPLISKVSADGEIDRKALESQIGHSAGQGSDIPGFLISPQEKVPGLNQPRTGPLPALPSHLAARGGGRAVPEVQLADPSADGGDTGARTFDPLTKYQEAAVQKAIQQQYGVTPDPLDPNINARYFDMARKIRESGETGSRNFLGEYRSGGGIPWITQPGNESWGGNPVTQDQFSAALLKSAPLNLQVSGARGSTPAYVSPELANPYRTQAAMPGYNKWQQSARYGVGALAQSLIPGAGIGEGSHQSQRPAESYLDDPVSWLMNAGISAYQGHPISGIGAEIPYQGSHRGHDYMTGNFDPNKRLFERLPDNSFKQQAMEAVADSFSLPKNYGHYNMASKLPGHPLHAMRVGAGAAMKTIPSWRHPIQSPGAILNTVLHPVKAYNSARTTVTNASTAVKALNTQKAVAAVKTVIPNTYSRMVAGGPLMRLLYAGEGARGLYQDPAELLNALSKSKTDDENIKIFDETSQGKFSRKFRTAKGLGGWFDGDTGKYLQRVLMGMEQPGYARQELLASLLDLPATVGLQGYGNLVSDENSKSRLGSDLSERPLPSWAQQGTYANLKQTQSNLASGLEELTRQIVSPEGATPEFKPLVIREGDGQAEDMQLRLLVKEIIGNKEEGTGGDDISQALAKLSTQDRDELRTLIRQAITPDGLIRVSDDLVDTRQAEMLIARDHQEEIGAAVGKKYEDLRSLNLTEAETHAQLSQYRIGLVTDLLAKRNKFMLDTLVSKAQEIRGQSIDQERTAWNRSSFYQRLAGEDDAAYKKRTSNVYTLSIGEAMELARKELSRVPGSFGSESMEAAIRRSPGLLHDDMSAQEVVDHRASVRAQIQSEVRPVEHPLSLRNTEALLQSEHQAAQSGRLQDFQNGLASFDKEEGITSRIEAARDVTAGVKFNRTTSLLVDQMQAEAGKIINATSTPESAKTWAQSVISAAEQYKEAAKADNPSSALSSAMISTGRAVRQDEMLLRQRRAEAENGTSNNEADEVPYTDQSMATIAEIEARLQNNRVRLNFFDELSGSEAAKQVDPQMSFTNKF